MFDSVTGAWATIFANPYIGVALFLAVTAGVILLFSGKENWLESIIGLFRVFFTVFTTPFVFLRDALANVRTAGDTEQDYAKTRVFMLFRYNRIQYMAIFVGALLILSAGIMTSALTLYPKAELDMHRQLREQVKQLQSEVDAASQAAAAASAAEFRSNLENAQAQALTAYQQQSQNNAAFIDGQPFRNSIVYELINARNSQTMANVRSNLDTYVSNCPNNYYWRGFTPDDCSRFRAFVLDLAERKDSEINLRQAYEQAQNAVRNADSAQREANERLAMLQANLENVVQQRDAISPFSAEGMGRRLGAVAGMLFSTLMSVVFFVWIGALVVDFFNWLILIMRSVERNHQHKLDKARAEAEPQS